ALIIAEEVATALTALSKYDMVHHDINPGNILLTRSGKVKLTGLGHAETPVLDPEMPSADPETATPGYAAPEQLIDFHAADGRADIYSLGTMLFEMLTGTVPYPEKTPQEILGQIRNAVQPDPRQYSGKISQAAAHLVMRMTAKRYFDRPADAGQLLKELHGLKIIPPGTDREQAVRELIAQAESGTYRPVSPVSQVCHADPAPAEKSNPSRIWTVVLAVLLLPLTWLAVKMFLPMIEEKVRENATVRQSAAQTAEEATARSSDAQEEAVSRRQDKNTDEEKSEGSGKPVDEPEQKTSKLELTPEELYRLAGIALQSGNHEKAVKLLEKASAGYPAAEMQLGMMYLEGRGLPADRNIGIRLLTHAAERGLAKAQYLLARYYKSGPDADPKQSLNWCRQAVRSGHAAAVKELALMLRDGFGCEPDLRGALFYLEQSAGKGDPESMYLAGEMYQNGQGTVRDPGKAEKYYRQAADAGVSDARKKLGQIELQKKRKQIYLNYQQKPPAELFNLAEDSFRNG
ncbi:MAG: SEL1-like repeat protein, partial [Lentisphaeria bacterium]|nr:SEL1-like repeat protein [Lentisphaeria bacterium]